jgi:L-erythro-3,5-diaminohexanoate dehydrogenase
MVMGNGYTKHHADMTLSILRESSFIKELYEKKYC